MSLEKDITKIMEDTNSIFKPASKEDVAARRLVLSQTIRKQLAKLVVALKTLSDEAYGKDALSVTTRPLDKFGGYMVDVRGNQTSTKDLYNKIAFHQLLGNFGFGLEHAVVSQYALTVAISYSDN